MTENVSCLINFDVSKGIKTVEKCVKSLRQDICDCIKIKYANNELREQNKKEKKNNENRIRLARKYSREE